MTGRNAPSPEFMQWVRNVLAHLYDYPYLQNHPLASRLPAEAGDGVTRAQALRRALVDCLEALQPEGGAEAAVEANRAYAILTYRYVDGLAIEEVAGELALSPRQTYREHDKGVKAVAGLLWDRLGEPEPPPARAEDGPPASSRVAQEEAARLHRAAQSEALDLREVLEAVLGLVGPLAQQKGLRIEVQPLEPPCSTVWADRTVLRQALLGLVGCALDQGCRGVLRLSAAAAEEGLRLEIVGSAGEGNPPQIAPLDERSRLNLEVARDLLQAQGGRLEIEAAGQLWRARLVLPTRRSVKILAIDDNTDLLALLGRYLGGYPVSVTACSDGAQALRLAAELRPQAILLDIMMPGLDGWELLQRLKSAPETQQTPVIICSVLSHIEMAKSLGASDYLVKPVTQVALLQVLRRWLGSLLPTEPPPPGASPEHRQPE